MGEKKGIQAVGRKEYLGKSPWKFYILITLSGEKNGTNCFKVSRNKIYGSQKNSY